MAGGQSSAPIHNGEHPFELAVEMDLITAELFQLAGVQRLAECLLADQGPHSGVDQDVALNSLALASDLRVRWAAIAFPEFL